MPHAADSQAFSPPVRAWFDAAFPAPTAVQVQAWAAIRGDADVLVAAPTGSGKTLAAFLCAIDDLVARSRQAPLEDRVHVLYVSPLKALSNDIERNLQAPLEGIATQLKTLGQPPAGIRARVRTGDTPPGEREKMRRQPPHILVTTPESLYILLTADSGRAMLAGVETVIVDEIHALAGNKRGCHLALTLARLDALCPARPRRIGLSATQKPIERVARFLSGVAPCMVVDTGHQRRRDLALELTGSPLSAVMPNEAWEEVYDRLAELVEAHETTLVFVNTRRLAERATRHLAERLGEDAVTAHHGSLSREHRLEAEQALKGGRLRALVATASLELGIDIGHVDLVCQLGSPGSMAALLQRVGRSGHGVGEVPKGRLFPLSRDDLVECSALLMAVERGELDAIAQPRAPLDVLAQQLVAELSAREWTTDELYAAVRSTWPYRDLPREDFDAVVRMLSEGYATRRGRRSAWLFHDTVNGRLRARPAARLTALQNGGTIPDQFDYEVVLLPQGHRVGTLNEDFAFESMPGDIFQLGNTSFRILKVEQGRVLVEDAAGQPPTIPFWVGERPGRSDELSVAVSGLNERLEIIFREHGERGPAEAQAWLRGEGLPEAAARQLVEYLHAAWQALDGLPTARRFVLERFFDETGDMHLVLHAPLGSRLMRAWGLALRKRFCRQFNFELQAAALEDALILSLGETHSFELAEVPGYLKPQTAREVLVQALLDAPMFGTRWRWNATTALALERMRNGRRLPPQWQRNNAEDLLAVVFPDQLACAENLAGAREIPDHPLVRQAIDDCLHEVMDVDGLVALLERLATGQVQVRCLDLTGPSPLSGGIINARPYAFLDDGEAENRRTRAIRQQPDDLAGAGALRIISVDAIQQVRDEAWIAPRSADELHDGLLQLGFLTQGEFGSGDSATGAAGDARQWPGWFATLVEEQRACTATLPGGERFWVAAERLPEWLEVHPHSDCRPRLPATPAPGREVALTNLLRDRLALLGPVDIVSLATQFALPVADIACSLLALQREGVAVRMDSGEEDARWCERRLLARIHRYSREQRRQAIRPVAPAAFARFLARWHGLQERDAMPEAALAQLEGWTAPVAAWEKALLPARCRELESQQLDQLFLSGRLAWFRPSGGNGAERQVVAASPIAIVPRVDLRHWLPTMDAAGQGEAADRGAYAHKVMHALQARGAMFTEDLERATGLLRPQLEEGLKALVYAGSVTADAFSPLRWLLRPEAQKARIESRRARHAIAPVGRWSLLAPGAAGEAPTETPAMQGQERLMRICQALLRRYGVVFRAVLQRETLLPPWRELLYCLRRLEDRGEVRGGRFVDGFSGEQFALPEAVGLLRQCQQGGGSELRVISAADPLNLGGFILPGPRTPALAANRVLLEDGLPVARLIGEEVEELPGISAAARRSAAELLRVVTPIRSSA